MSTTKLLAGFAAAAALVGAASPVWADLLEEPVRTIKPVQLDDLNLASEAGATNAYFRLRYAAERACGQAPILMNINRSQIYRACVNDTVGVAVASVNQPMLAAVAAEHIGAQQPTYLAAR